MQRDTTWVLGGFDFSNRPFSVCVCACVCVVQVTHCLVVQPDYTGMLQVLFWKLLDCSEIAILAISGNHFYFFSNLQLSFLENLK